jgi:hypothetical protein
LNVNADAVKHSENMMLEIGQGDLFPDTTCAQDLGRNNAVNKN